MPSDHLFLCLSVHNRFPHRGSAAELAQFNDDLAVLTALDVGLQGLPPLDLLACEPQARVVLKDLFTHEEVPKVLTFKHVHRGLPRREPVVGRVGHVDSSSHQLQGLL